MQSKVILGGHCLSAAGTLRHRVTVLTLPHSTKVIVHLVVHILVSVVLFVIVGAAATFLWWITEVMSQYKVSPLIQTGLHFVADGVFLTDILCFTLHTIVTVWTFLKDLWFIVFPRKDVAE